MKKQILETADGSTSIYLEELDEHYHSKHGAIAESEHIFIDNGLLAKIKLEKIRVLEIGMGTGLNVLTTCKAAMKNNLNVEMHTLEAYPISDEHAKQMNFAELLGVEKSIFEKVHSSEWNVKQQLSENLEFIKYLEKIEEFAFPDVSPKMYFDVIYFDAFAPEKQEEIWDREIFEKLFKLLKHSGILVTYCVKGVIRRRLAEVGFTVEKLAGPKNGKREMCRAIKPVL